MITEAQLDRFVRRVRMVCGPNARSRALWLVGPPRTGKSTFCQHACHRAGWHYLNYTMDPLGLPSLAGQEGLYKPDLFLEWMRATAPLVGGEVLVVDEIESLLGWWHHDQQLAFLRTVSRAKELPKGFLLVTRLAVARAHLPAIAPNNTLTLEEVLQ